MFLREGISLRESRNSLKGSYGQCGNNEPFLELTATSIVSNYCIR